MAKKVYVGVGDKARNVTKIYVGVNGVAKKVIAGYIGVSGVAKLFFGTSVASGLIKYTGTIQELSTNRDRLAATTIGDYALFGGGHNKSTSAESWTKNVDAYRVTLTRSKLSNGLQSASASLAATTVGNYALFGGGGTNTTFKAYVTAYNTKLTRSYPTDLSFERNELAATTIGNYALFGGGYTNNAVAIATVDGYTVV
jgi:hypothetical protein